MGKQSLRKEYLDLVDAVYPPLRMVGSKKRGPLSVQARTICTSFWGRGPDLVSKAVSIDTILNKLHPDRPREKPRPSSSKTATEPEDPLRRNLRQQIWKILKDFRNHYVTAMNYEEEEEENILDEYKPPKYPPVFFLWTSSDIFFLAGSAATQKTWETHDAVGRNQKEIAKKIQSDLAKGNAAEKRMAKLLAHEARKKRKPKPNAQISRWIPDLTYTPLERPALMRSLKTVLFDKTRTTRRTRDSRRHMCLYGMPGVGKTVIAIALCRDPDVWQGFERNIAWITLGKDLDDAQLCDKQGQIARALGLKPFKQSSSVETNRHTLNALIDQKKCLLVFDDAWQKKDVESICAPGARGIVLVTTQRKELAHELNAIPCKLPPPDSETAWQILRYWSDSESGDLPFAAKQVVEECGNLPLALAMCGRLARKDMGWDSLNALLKSADLDAISQQLPGYRDCPSLLKALQVGISEIPRRRIDYLARFLDLGIFPEDTRLPIGVVQRVWSTAGLRPEELYTVIFELDGRSLIEYHEEDKTVSLHDLFLDYCRTAPESDIVTAHGRLVDAYWEDITHNVNCPMTEPQRWADGPRNDGYFFWNIARHMLAAHRYSDCVDLLTCLPEWMRRQRDVCGSDAQFRDDVTKAMATIPPEDTPENLIAFTKLWTARLITKHSEAISDQLLMTMSRVGKVDDALSIVRSRPDTLSKLSSFIAIYSAVADQPPSTLLDAVSDLEARLDLHAQLHIDIGTLVSTSEILGHRGLVERSESLFHKAKQMIDAHNPQLDRVRYLAYLAVAFHRLDNPSRSRAAIKKAARTLHVALPHEGEAYTSALLTLLEASLACTDKESPSLLAQARDEVGSIPKHWDSHCACFQTIEAICHHNAEAAAELLDAIHTEATMTHAARNSDFWAAFIHSYLMLPAPDILLVERILPRATSELNVTSVITLSCVSIRLSLAGRKGDAQKYADEAAEAYNSYVSTYSDVDALNSEPWTGLLAAFTYSHDPIYMNGEKIDRGAILQWIAGMSLTTRSSCSYADVLKQTTALACLSAAFTHLGKNDVEQPYTQSMVNAIADVSGLPMRAVLLAKCAHTFAAASLMDKARGILDNCVVTLYETTGNPEYDDYRVETLHLLARVECIDEAVTLLKWSCVSSARRVCLLIKLFAAFSRRGDLNTTMNVYAKYVRSLARWLGRGPSANEVVAVISSLLDAKREEDALDLVRALPSDLFIAKAYIVMATRALQEGRQTTAKEYLSTAMGRMNPGRLLSLTSSIKAVVEVPGLPRLTPYRFNEFLLEDMACLLNDVSEGCDAEHLLEEGRAIVRETRKEGEDQYGKYGEPSHAELEIEALETAVDLAKKITCRSLRAEAYVHLGKRAARRNALEKAMELWDLARDIVDGIENEADVVRVLLLLAHSMRDYASRNRTIKVLDDVHRLMCNGHFGGNWGTRRPEDGFVEERELREGLRCRMNLIAEYAMLHLNEKAEEVLREVHQDVELISASEDTFLEMVRAIIKCGLYRRGLQLLLQARIGFALGASISMVLSAVSSHQPGLSVEILRHMAEICAWVRPEWNEVVRALKRKDEATLEF